MKRKRSIEDIPSSSQKQSLNRYPSSQANESTSMLIRQAPASTAFKNASLARATEYEHVQEVPIIQETQKKQDLLEQMGMQGLSSGDVKIYGAGGMKFSVNDNDINQSLPQARHENKAKLDQVVHDKVNELERQFEERDNKIQQIVEQEQQLSHLDFHMKMSVTNVVPPTQNLLKMDTGAFIQTIQEHMDEGLATGFNGISELKPVRMQSSRLDQAKKQMQSLGVAANDHYPLDVSVMQQQSERNLTLLPEINGPIKSVRKLLMQDLEADGVIRRNIPFSSSRRGLGNLSRSPSQVTSNLPTLKNSPSISSIQSAKSIILNNPFASRHGSVRPMPSHMRDSSTQLSMKLKKIAPDHSKNIIVANVNAINGPNNNRNFKKTQTLTPIKFEKKAMNTDRSISSILKETLEHVEDRMIDESTSHISSQRKLPRAKSPKIKRVLPTDQMNKRIPDTEHLTRMRALLVAAHQNEAFIKKLTDGNQYIPANLDPKGSEEMGHSFAQLLKRNGSRLQRKVDKAERSKKGLENGQQDDKATLEALIRGDDLNQHNAMASDSEDDVSINETEQEEGESPTGNNRQAQTTIRLLQSPLQNTTGTIATEAVTKTSLSSGLPTDKIALAIQNVDFKLGLDNANAKMIREHMERNEDRGQMRELARAMGKNNFFKLFVGKYQKGLVRALDASLHEVQEKEGDKANKKEKKPAGPTSPPPETKKDGSKSVPPRKNRKSNFGKLIMDHVNNSNFFRKQLPNIFTGEAETDISSVLTEKLKTLTPVPMPTSIKIQEMHEQNLEMHRSPKATSPRFGSADLSPIYEKPVRKTLDGIKRGSQSVGRRANSLAPPVNVGQGMQFQKCLLDDTAFLNRLKQKNYGKWYMKPEDYAIKNQLLAKHLAKINEMKN